ncbi:MAG: IS1182 family transposase [Dehalococcoidia bacterium]|nr:IS1182 family transposase [Dehalococcoidia bacterium]
MPERPYTRDQAWLLPPSLDELIPADHVVRFIASFVESLDLSALKLTPVQAMGAPAYPAEVLLAAWIYGFMLRVRSSRKIEVAAREHLPLLWLLGGHRPDHATLARFVRANRGAMKALFRQTVKTAVRVGLVDFALQAVDGTKVSTLSRDKILSGRDLEALGQKTDEAIARLEQGIAAEEASGEGGQAPRLPKELTDARRLREQVQAARREVEKREAERTAAHEGAVDAQTGEPRGPQVHLADPQAVLVKGRHGFVVGYNAQAVVDSKAQIMVGAEVVASATDTASLLPMLQEAEESSGRRAEVSVADAGYHSAQNVAAVEGTERAVYMADPALRRTGRSPEDWAYHKDHFTYDAATDTYICPQGRMLRYAFSMKQKGHAQATKRVYECHACAGCPARAVCTRDQSGRRIHIGPHDEELKRHRAELRSAAVKELLKRRSSIVEPVFAMLREHQGLIRFLRRGLDNVRAEWHLLTAAYNLLKVWRLHWRLVIRTASA